MEQATVNQRIKSMVEHYCRGNKSAFAKEAGITSQSLGEIIGGRQSAPSFVALQKIALAYPSISLNWLVLGEGPMFELTDEDPAHKLELFASEIEDEVDRAVKAGELPERFATPSTQNPWTLREEEEIARAELTGAIEFERITKGLQFNRAQAGQQDSEAEAEELSRAEARRIHAEKAYIIATRNRIRTERAATGFSTSSITAVYKLGEEGDSNSLYEGLLTQRLSISNEAAERLVKSGRIRATYIEGEGYRITEQAVRIFLGEF